MARARFRGREATLALLARLSAEVKAQVDDAVKIEAEGLAAKIRNNAPVEHGDLRDSVRVEKRTDRQMSYLVRVGGLPSTRKAMRKGGPEGDYSLWVEFGHMAEDGRHVPAQAFVFPTYRLERKKINARLRKAVRQALGVNGRRS